MTARAMQLRVAGSAIVPFPHVFIRRLVCCALGGDFV